jgi:hypothetical protein
MVNTFGTTLAWRLGRSSSPEASCPPGVRMTNVNFYRSHEAELKKLGENKQADCDNR